MVMAIIPILSLLMWLYGWDQFVRLLNPALVAAFWAVTFLGLRAVAVKKDRIDATDVVIAFALPAIAASLAYVLWYERDPWTASREGMPLAFVWAPLMAAGVTLVVYLIARAVRARKPDSAAWAFMVPINLLIIFSQLTDGFATALGIDIHGYVEKHVLSARVIHWGEALWGAIGWQWAVDHATFMTFVPVKLAVSLLVVYAMDVKAAEDADRHETLIGLAKFAIIMVGIGPGVRDFVRLSLGV
jgi:uncharacterized membrane protein